MRGVRARTTSLAVVDGTRVRVGVIALRDTGHAQRALQRPLSDYSYLREGFPWLTGCVCVFIPHNGGAKREEKLKCGFGSCLSFREDQTYQIIVLDSSRTNIQCAVVPHMFCVGTSLFPPTKRQSLAGMGKGHYWVGKLWPREWHGGHTH